MPIASDSLPDDIAALKALLLARDGEVAQLRTTVSTLEQALSVRSLEIEQLKLQLAKLKRMQFGRKSEKLDRKIEELETRLEDLVAEEGAGDQQAGSTAPRSKSERRPLPEHLVRQERVLEPQEQACARCGGELKPLGEDVSEQLDIIDSAFKVIRHIRRKKACAGCDHIAQAAAPSRPIERGIAGPGLLAQILVAKFADHQPLYRQSAIYARHGVELDRSTMARWVGACGALMRPLVGALRADVLAPGNIHSDDTPMPVLAPGKGQTKTGACLGLAFTWCEHRHGRVVGVDIARREHVGPQGPDQRAHQGAASAHPARHRRAVQFHAVSRVDGRLAVQGLVVGELGHQDLRQQSGAGDAALDRAARRGGLGDVVATGASLFAPDVADHLEGAVDDVQLLGNVLTQRLEFAATSRAGLLLRLEHALLAHQVFRQRSAFGLAARRC